MCQGEWRLIHFAGCCVDEGDKGLRLGSCRTFVGRGSGQGCALRAIVILGPTWSGNNDTFTHKARTQA